MDPDLFEVYRKTSFFANTPEGRLRIRVGELCSNLDRLLREEGLHTWAYVTAYNPGSVVPPGEENLQRQEHLNGGVA